MIKGVHIVCTAPTTTTTTNIIIIIIIINNINANNNDNNDNRNLFIINLYSVYYKQHCLWLLQRNPKI